jgi:hypothetical protein
MPQLQCFSRIAHNLSALGFPFETIVHGIVQEFVARYAKDSALSQLLRQWDNVIVKKPQFSLVPAQGGSLSVRPLA